MNRETFYSGGLSFSCTRCSRCCRYESGYVFLSYQDLKKLCIQLKLSPGEFVKNYCREVDLGICKRLSLTEKENYDCIFWEETGCSVYPSRPLQCISYPFWEPHLESPGSWNALSKDCPGVGRGRLYTAEEIEKWLIQRRQERFIDLNKDDLTWMEEHED